MQLQHAALRICWRSFAASVTIAVISVAVAVAVIIVIIDIAAPAATAAIAHRVCVCCCRQLYCYRRKIIVIAISSSSIGMQSSAVHGRAVARNSSYCEAPTLRSNATTSRLFMSMAHLRGVLPSLQAGG